jgi:RND family efflux transporter MFP subunit
MSEVELLDRWRKPANDRITEAPPENVPDTRVATRRGWGGRLVGMGLVVVFGGALAVGGWRYYAQQRETVAVSQQRRNFVPSVRVATVRAGDEIVIATLPATTSAFAVANIFARASGYIDKRYVDIGDRVKEGQLLVEITAPELDHQIAQAEATLVQLQAAHQQAQANRDLAQVTWNRDSPLVKQGWVTQQQGSVDVQTLKAQEAAVGVAQANVVAQEAQLKVLRQQKAYQRVLAPFDGVITQRNIDVGSLVQADAVSSTFMFTIMQSDVIRAQVFVPQDQAFGLTPGIGAIVRVPEIPNRTFPGKVTRVADALAPGTRTLLTEIDIENPDGMLTPGTYGTIELHIPRKTPSLRVPAEAIIFNAGGLQVAVVKDGVAHIQKISVGRDLGTAVEVVSGVAAGNQVILNPPVSLSDGARVHIRPEPPT